VKNHRRGFTLAELLIVVAIIAVLVAISIPVFAAQKEAAKQAVDLANLRAAYSDAATNVTATGRAGSAVTPAMKHSGAFDRLKTAQIGNLDLTADSAAAPIVKDKTVTVTVATDGTVTLSSDGEGGSGSGSGEGGSGSGLTINASMTLDEIMAVRTPIPCETISYADPGAFVETSMGTSRRFSSSGDLYVNKVNAYFILLQGDLYRWDGSAWQPKYN